MSSAANIRLSADVGGTFTDLVLIDETTGEVRLAKVPTTVENQAFGVLKALEDAGLPLADVAMIVHGTTTTTNAVLERKLSKTGLITTQGFRDVLELGRRLVEGGRLAAADDVFLLELKAAAIDVVAEIRRVKHEPPSADELRRATRHDPVELVVTHVCKVKAPGRIPQWAFSEGVTGRDALRFTGLKKMLQALCHDVLPIVCN